MQLLCLELMHSSTALSRLQFYSGQVRAMQIIDELEVNKRGPYGGGMGYVAYNGNMDIALALRTMVIPNPPPSSPPASNGNTGNPRGRKTWTVHLQVYTVPS